MFDARLATLTEAIRAGRLEMGPHMLTKQTIRRGIEPAALETALLGPAEVIEEYPDDVRGASCLLICWVAGRALHVVVKNPPAPFVITAYWPDERAEKWSIDFRRRLP